MFKYKILAVIIVIVYFLQPFFFSNGGIGADSLSYFGIAADLPNPETNLFPLGYPILLRVLYNVVYDWFWASKILNILFVIGILGFSYFRKFYFRETVLLFTGKTCFFVFLQAMSEGPFIFLLYFLFYFLHQIFAEKNRGFQNAVMASIILIVMFSVRYSGIYIYASFLLFFVLMFFKIRKAFYFKPLMLFGVLSGTGIFSYLLFNYLVFGTFTGENLRGVSMTNLPIDIIRSVLGVINVVDPFIGIKPSSLSFASMAFQFLVFVIDVVIFAYLLQFFRKAKNDSLYYFHILLWYIACVYAFALLISGWFQQIEEMNVRMMAAANICLFFSFLILYFKNVNQDKYLWRISCFFFVFLAAYNLKDADNYLKNKSKIEPQMVKFKDKKYLYNNEKHIETITSYQILGINKVFYYKHTNKQKGTIKENIVGTLNPKIKWLMNDSVQDKSKVLYTSQIKFD